MEVKAEVTLITALALFSVTYMASLHTLPPRPLPQPTIDMTQPFRFLDLPIELRLIVYEYLPVTATIHTYDLRTDNGRQCITLERNDLPVALLRTCQLIRNEASPIISRLIWTHSPRATFESIHPASDNAMASTCLLSFLLILASTYRLLRVGISAPAVQKSVRQHPHASRRPFDSVSGNEIMDFIAYAGMWTLRTTCGLEVKVYWPALDEMYSEYTADMVSYASQAADLEFFGQALTR